MFYFLFSVIPLSGFHYVLFNFFSLFLFNTLRTFLIEQALCVNPTRQKWMSLFFYTFCEMAAF